MTRTIVLKHGRRLLASLLAFPTRATTNRFIIGEPSVVDMSLFASVCDDGVTWTALVVQAPAGLSPNAVVAAVPGALYAAAIAPTASYSVGASFRLTLMRSTDGGAHWSALSLTRPAQT